METLPLVLSAVFVFTGFVAMIVGVTTPFWFSNPSEHGGLFILCVHGNMTGEEETCGKLGTIIDFGDIPLPSWEGAVRALVLIPCILSFINFMLIVAHISRGHERRRQCFRTVSTVTLSTLSGLLCQIGMLVYFLHQDVGEGGACDWSYHVTSAGGYLVLLPLVVIGDVDKGRPAGLGF